MSSDEHGRRTSHDDMVITCGECDYHHDDHRMIVKHVEAKGHLPTQARRGDVETDSTIQENTPIPKVVVGAWKEALGETGWKRLLLLFILATTTIPFLPLWALLWLLQMAGFYHKEKGFKLP